jgi:NAD(P)-dependent dehydrogenase (short-subunit alcohol dehydrogenase family)
MTDVRRQTVVVTGAGSGIGHETAAALVAGGYRVLAWDVAPGGLAGTRSPFLTFQQADVRDRDAMQTLARAEEERGEVICGLVACAAILRRVPYLELDEATWDAHFAVNLKGSLFACQAVLPMMRRNRAGSIVLFSSSIARSGSPTGAHYAATKGGVLGLMRSLALDVAADGIRVNAISPGVTDTPQPRAHSTEAQLYAKAGRIPLGRIGQPEDMAQAVLFLIGEDSSYVTGQDIRINGGGQIF